MDNRKYQDLIEDYLDSRLDDAARKEFERELASDPELKKLTRRTALLADALARKAEAEILAGSVSGQQSGVVSLNRDAQADTGAQKSLRGKIVRAVSVAAVVALLVWYGNGRRYTGEELYGEYFDPAYYEPAPSRGTDEWPEEYSQELPHLLVDAFTGKDYHRVLEIGAPLLGKPWVDDIPGEYMLMMAVSLLEADRPDDAAELALYLIDRPDSGVTSEIPTVGEDARWLMAWIELRRGDRRAARSVLAEIVASGSPYGEAAAEVKSSLAKRRWF